jgi:hypothetical protein
MPATDLTHLCTDRGLMRNPPFLAMFFEQVRPGTPLQAQGTSTLTESREEVDSDENWQFSRASAGTITATFSREEADSDIPVSLGTTTCTRAREEDDADFSPGSIGTATFTKEREESDADSPVDRDSAMWECGIL